MEGCHNDGDPSNARLANLRWDTPRRNNADKVSHGTYRRGQDHHSAKIKEHEAREILRRALGSEPMKEIASDFGVSWQLVSMIKHGRRWKHLQSCAGSADEG